MALFANLSVPTLADPAPTNGLTGSLPAEGLFEGGEAEGQSNQWSAYPAEKPSATTRSRTNRGTN